MRTFKVQQQRRKGQLGGSNLASKMQFLDFIYLDAILPPAESKGFFFVVALEHLWFVAILSYL